MKKTKHLFCILLALCMMGGLTPVYAAENSKVKVYVDDGIISFDVQPIITNGNTLVPIRPVCEALGADLRWDESTRTAVVTRAGKEIKLTIDSTTAYVNGKAYTLSIAPIASNGRTLLPLRFIMEQFGQKLEWVGASQSIYIEADTSFLTEKNNMMPWILGCNAILAKRNGEDPYTLGWSSRTAAAVEIKRGIMSGSWGIDSREDLLETIAMMTDGGHSASFDNDVEMLKMLKKTGQYDAVIADSGDMDKYMWKMVEDLDQKWEAKSIKAWDWFRMMHLVNWGYVSGYIELSEAHEICAPIAERLKMTFSSWDEATKNYMDGYMYWLRMNPNQPTQEYTKRLQIYEDLKNSQTSTKVLFDPAVWK